tara:strand:- start:21 stop:551 length:531 start_codon:yes stop_codon:yes gene_type:complete
MKDFAEKNKKKKQRKNKSIFTLNRSSQRTISSKSITMILITSLAMISVAFFYLKTDVESIKRKDVSNSISINFPTSLLENPVLIEVADQTDSLECEYFVQIGAYGNKKYALEAENMLSNQISNISITEVYSSLQPGRLLNSVISGPYKNKSSANNAKEKITIEGFEPTLRTRCEQK